MKYRLGDICTITKGATGIMKAILGDYTMIALGEMDKTHIEYQFDAKAVIIPLVSSTGHGHASMKRVKYFEGKFALGNILCAVIPNDENFVLAKYLHIYLHWNREELLVSQMKGMANVSLPMNRIADVMVTVPSIEKQKEIVELEKILVTKEVEANKLFTDQLTQLENLNQAILQEAVQGKLVDQNPDDEPASKLLKHIKAEKALSGKKEKPLPPLKPEEISFEIPESWVWCRLGEICEINPRNKFEDDIDAGFIPMPLVSQLFGIKPSFELKSWGKIKNGFTHFANDDVVVAKITPCFENSKAGIISGLPNGVGAGTTELNVIRGNGYVLPDYIYAFIKRAYFLINGKKIMRGVAGQQRVPTEYFYNALIPLPPLSEQKRIVAEIEKQFTKTKKLKEHITANQQATEQLLKTLLHQAFEVKEYKVKTTIQQTKGKVVELDTNSVNWNNLVAEPFEKYAAHPVNNIQDIDWEMAMMVACMKNKLGVTYGDVGLQKNVFNTNNLQPIFSKQYTFANSNFGTYCHELKEDLKRNPYLVAQKVANNKEVYTVNPKYSKQVLDKLSAPENKEFLKAINRILSIYEHPFINKETDKIELYNTVLKVALDENTRDIEIIYKGMKNWKIKQERYKTKAEKFNKLDAERMLKLLMEKKILSDGALL
jgi:type I restriction enzyme, S subunit